jgi:branched-chain amino acid transport system substrate-binding protein
MRARATSVLALLVAAALGTAACGSTTSSGGSGSTGTSSSASTPGVTSDQILIGTHTPLTGPAGYVGEGFEVGEKLAVDQINAAGGINGRKLKVDYLDDMDTPPGAITAARELVEQDNVFAVLGGGASTGTSAVIPYFTQNGVPYYVSLASTPTVLQGKAKNIFLGATIPAQTGVAAYTKFLTQTLHAKKVALMVCDQANCTAGAPLLTAALKADGVAVTTTADFASGATDYTGQVQQVKNSDPDAVFLYGLVPDDAHLVDELRSAGVTAPIVGDTSIADPTFVQLAGAAAANGVYGFYLGGKQLVNDDTGAMAIWLKDLHADEPSLPVDTPNLYSLMAYADTYVLAQAILKAGKNLTRAGLIASLNTNVNDFLAGADGTWPMAQPVGLPRTFSAANHQGTANLTLVKVVDGKFVAQAS